MTKEDFDAYDCIVHRYTNYAEKIESLENRSRVLRSGDVDLAVLVNGQTAARFNFIDMRDGLRDCILGWIDSQIAKDRAHQEEAIADFCALGGQKNE